MSIKTHCTTMLLIDALMIKYGLKRDDLVSIHTSEDQICIIILHETAIAMEQINRTIFDYVREFQFPLIDVNKSNKRLTILTVATD